MAVWDDMRFATALERSIMLTLWGEENGSAGLYRSLKGAQTWEAFQRASGEIAAYERVLDEMRNIARRVNDGEVVRQQGTMN